MKKVTPQNQSINKDEVSQIDRATSMMNFIRYIPPFCIYIIAYLIVKKQERLYYKFFYCFEAFVSINNGAKMIIYEFSQGETRAEIIHNKREYGVMNREIKHKQSGNGPNKYAHFKDKIKHGGMLLSFGIYSISYQTL